MPPIHHAGQRGTRPSAAAVCSTQNKNPTPATNHTRSRAITCIARDGGIRGRSQFRNHTSTQCPPNDGHNTSKLATAHPASPPRKPMIAPTTIAIATVRNNVVRSGSL